jgi:hypothetical protein
MSIATYQIQIEFCIGPATQGQALNLEITAKKDWLISPGQ